MLSPIQNVCLLLTLLSPTVFSFTTVRTFTKSTRLYSEEVDTTEDRRNPNNPNLPEVAGDFDWDEKYGDDPEWITENIPGKVALGDVELAKQVAALSALEEKWRKDRVRAEYEEKRLLGWSKQAETYNGRFAMFFLVVGLVTEYYTDVSFPGQIEEMLRVGGFIGLE